MKTAVLREKGQITLPQEIVDAAGWEVGDVIDWRFEGGELRGKRRDQPKRNVLTMADVDPKTLLPKKGKTDLSRIKEAVRLGRERGV